MDSLNEEEVSFDYDWLTREDYQFKILALVAVLADNHLAYRGTLADMCDFFGINGNNSRTNRKIKDAIDALEKDGLLKKIIDGLTYTLTLSKKAERQRRVIRIQKMWVEVAKSYPSWKSKSESVSWENLLRVWLYFLDESNARKSIVTNRDIADEINMRIGTVKNARSALIKDIHALISQKLYEGCDGEYYRCIGAQVTPLAWIEELRHFS